jgi:hypothetical protein
VGPSPVAAVATVPSPTFTTSSTLTATTVGAVAAVPIGAIVAVLSATWRYFEADGSTSGTFAGVPAPTRSLDEGVSARTRLNEGVPAVVRSSFEGVSG